MGKLDAVPGNPGLYAFRCDCGYEKRRVVETERFFMCERPVEAKVSACKLTHEFQPLLDAMKKRYAEAEAKKFLEENEAKVAQAKAVLGVKKSPEAKTPPPVTSTQSDVETKVIQMPQRGPGRPKKENK